MFVYVIYGLLPEIKDWWWWRLHTLMASPSKRLLML